MTSKNFNIPHEYHGVVIRQSKYNGLYEGGKFFCYSEIYPLPESYSLYLEGDDDAALDFWYSDDSKLFGAGDSPNDALINFLKKLKSNNNDQYEYKNILTKFETKIIQQNKPEIIERTDYFQTSQPIFLPRKNKEF